NTEQIILAMSRLARETDNTKIAVVLDNARFHHAKALKNMLAPGGQLENLRLWGEWRFSDTGRFCSPLIR
ncbi:hypothetical protein, partial [Actinomyces oricola]